MNHKPSIRWGILSTGHIAERFAKALKGLPEAERYAVASRTQGKAEAFAKEHGFRKAYGSYQALAEDPEVDVIYIGTPHVFHLENTLMCLRAGKAVLCEKALTINVREAEEMIRVAREEKVFLMEAMITPHVPLIKKIIRWIREGKIGEVRMIRASRCIERSFDKEARQLNLSLGGGSLLDLGVYPIAFAATILEREPVEAFGTAHIGEWGTDEQGAALLRYDNGTIADITFALRTETVNDAFIHGTEGFIHIDEIFAVPHRATRYDKEKKVVEQLEEPVRGQGLGYEAEEVMRCLREGLSESPLMPLDRSLQIMRTMDRIREPWGMRYPNDEF
jgi:predicted dehydrogenase